jgi:Kef-type K+ transport system membrane component KefB
MILISQSQVFGLPPSASPTLVLGFLLLAAYCIGFIVWKLGFPWITGYIFAGLFLGPYFFKFYDQNVIEELGFINSLALAFIAFCAGGELRLENIRRKLKSIIYLITGVTSAVFLGVTLSIFAFSDLIPFLNKFDLVSRISISAIFGVIAVARSPSSAIAIISETKAKGEYTDTVLSVTIAMDVVIIIFFAVVVSVSETVLSAEGIFNISFVLILIIEIGLAFVLGFFLGKGIIFLIDRVKAEFPVVIAAMGFLVIKFCHLMGDYLQETHDISLKLEPLLICMAAGFTVQNFSKHGSTFLERMDRVSFPIYVAFFAITGATINMDILKTGWFLGIIIFISRVVMIYFGSYFSGKLSKDRPEIYKNTWLGFITQAGVSLGLLTEVVRRFPEIGVSIQSILIATITLNQIVGPIAFKFALKKVGETNLKKNSFEQKPV